MPKHKTKQEENNPLANDNLKTDIGLRIYQEMIRDLVKKNKIIKRNAQIMEEVVIMGKDPRQVGRKYKVHSATITRIKAQYRKLITRVIEHYELEKNDQTIKRRL